MMDNPKPPTSMTNRPRVLRALRIALALGVVGFLFWSLWHTKNASTLSAAHGLGVLAALPVSILSMVFAAFRLQCLTGRQVNFIHALKSCSLAVAFTYISPGKLADGAKPLYLKSTAGLPITTGFAALFFERMIDLLCVLGLLGFFVFALDSSAAYMTPLKGFAVFFAMLLAGFLALMAYPQAFTFMVRQVPLPWLRLMLTHLMQAVQRLSDPRRLLGGLFFGVLTWAMSYAIYVCYFSIATSTPLSSEATLAVFILSTIGMAAALLPAGLGTFEGAMVLALSAYGYSAGDALIAALMLRITTMIPPVLVTLKVIMFDHFDLSQLKPQQETKNL